MTARARKPKPDPYGTESMFDVTDLVDTHPVSEPKSIASVAQGNCPSCSRDKVGLIPYQLHLVWRPHTYMTWKNRAVPCPASGHWVCRLPEAVPPHTHSEPVRCRHGSIL